MFKYLKIALFLLTITLSETFGVPEGRIVGGDEVDISKNPHQITLRYRIAPRLAFSHSCGGSIIRDNVILTAAHCTNGRKAKDFVIVAGTNNREGGDGAISLVSKIVPHRNYSGATTDYDISLLFLATPLPLNNVTMAAIELTTEPPKLGSKAVISGWGTLASGGMLSDKLREVAVPIMSNEMCNAAYAEYFGSNVITENMFCAGFVGVGGKDSCQGDSGGGLLVNKKISGIVSWGIGCAFPDYPGVYTNVFNFRTWINDTILENAQ